MHGTAALQTSQRKEPLRNSGLEFVGEIPWGTHFCQFYAERSDLLETLIPYFASGLAANEYCMWVTSHQLSSKEIEAALRKAVPGLDRHLADGQIEIFDHTQWYMLDGSFNGERVLSGWLDKLNVASCRGFDGLRLSGDTLWLEKNTWQSFAQYEYDVDRIISGSRILALCTYSIDKCNMRDVLDVFANHEFALVKEGDRWETLQNVSRYRAEQARDESDARFKALYDNMIEAFALHEIITDQKGDPCDYRFLDFNPAFERLTSLNGNNLRGKRVLEILPKLEPSWIETYGRVALTGQPAHFEEYAAPLGRWYDVVAYQTEPGRFATVFSDVTERKQTERKLRWNAQRNKLLSDTAAHLLESNNPQEVVEDLCRKVMAFLDCQVFFNYLVDEHAERLHLNACAGISKEAVRASEWLDYGVAVCGCVAQEGHRIIATDIGNTCDRRTDLVRSYGVQAYCCHPLMARGRLIGTLSFGTRSRQQFTDDEIDVMEAVTDLVAMAMTRTQVEEALRDNKARLASEAKALVILDEVGTRLWRTQDLQEGLHEILAATIELLGADKGNVQLFDTKRNVLEIAAQVGFDKEFLCYFSEVSADDGSAYGRILRHGGRIVIEDVETDERCAPMRQIARASGFRAVQSTPLIGRDGAFLGMLSTHFRSPHQPTAQELHRLDLYVRKAVDFIERLKMEEAVRESNERLRAIMESLPVGVSVVDATGGSITHNAAFNQIWGEPRPDVERLADFCPYQAWWADTGEPLAADDWASTRAIQRGETVEGQLLRITAFDGRTVFINNNAAPIRDARGNTAGAAVAVLDITALVRANEALRLNEIDLKQAQSVGSIGSWRLDVRKNELTWSEENHRIFGILKGTPLTYESFLNCVHPDDRAYVDSQWQAGLKGEPYDIEHRLLVNGEEKWVRERAVLEFDANGELLGGFGVTQDISARKRREAQIQLLLREVNHRAKNVLALVQAIAWQTTATNAQDFVDRFSLRIGALATSQDLLVACEWRGVEIEALLRSQLAHFGDVIDTRITLDGPLLRLSASACQSLGMVVHELSTNAGKHGALSDTLGKVHITWNVERHGGSDSFVITWTERGGPPVASPSRYGFGHTVLVAMPKLELDADVRLEFAPEGLNWRLTCAAASVMDPASGGNIEEQ